MIFLSFLFHQLHFAAEGPWYHLLLKAIQLAGRRRLSWFNQPGYKCASKVMTNVQVLTVSQTNSCRNSTTQWCSPLRSKTNQTNRLCTTLPLEVQKAHCVQKPKNLTKQPLLTHIARQKYCTLGQVAPRTAKKEKREWVWQAFFVLKKKKICDVTRLVWLVAGI